MTQKHRSPRSISPWLCTLLVLSLVGCAPADNSGTNENGAPNGTGEQATAAGDSEVNGRTAANADAAAETATTTATEPAVSEPAQTEPAIISTTAAGADASDAKKFHVSGAVTYGGPPPERKPINMERDEKCIEIHGDAQVLSEDLIVSDDGGMQNVFVYVRGGVPKQDYPVPEEIGVLDQKGCMYRPRVQGVRAGQTFHVVNSDPLLHNVRGIAVRNRSFNMGQKPGSEPRERVFKRAERPIELQCDVHTWMRGYIFVMDHPFFAVTDEDGNFSIEGLPPGEYTLAAWHEKYRREVRQKITIGEEDVTEFNFAFESLGE